MSINTELSNYTEDIKIYSFYEFADLHLPKDLKAGDIIKIPLFRPGKWKHEAYGEITISEADLHEMEKNSTNKSIRKTTPVLDENHDPDHKSAGLFTKLYVTDGVLYSDIKLNKKGAELINDEVYHSISPEIAFIYKHKQTGKTFKNVVLGAALTNRPFFEDNILSEKYSEYKSDNDNSIFIKQLTKNNQIIMDKVQKLAFSLIAKKEKLTEEEVKSFNEELTKLSEDEQKELAEYKDTIEARFEEDSKEEPDLDSEPEANEDDKEKEKDKTKDEDKSDKDDEENEDKKKENDQTIKANEGNVEARFKEMENKLKAAEKTANEAKTELRNKKITQRYKGLAFSEENPEGKILPKALDSAIELAKKFSDVNESLEEKFFKFCESNNPAWANLKKDPGITGEKPKENKFKEAEKTWENMGLSEEEAK